MHAGACWIAATVYIPTRLTTPSHLGDQEQLSIINTRQPRCCHNDMEPVLYMVAIDDMDMKRYCVNSM
jgi:hypothetical protein